ncbi:MAG: hypothetical protein WB816_11160 [Methylocystis sp.]
MKSLATLQRRLARIEVALPTGVGGLIRIGKGMRGLREALARARQAQGEAPLLALEGQPLTAMQSLRTAMLAEKETRAKMDALPAPVESEIEARIVAEILAPREGVAAAAG